jgi:hypothetical protein
MLYSSSIGRVLLSLHKVLVPIVDTCTHNMAGSEPAGQSKTETSYSKILRKSLSVKMKTYVGIDTNYDSSYPRTGPTTGSRPLRPSAFHISVHWIDIFNFHVKLIIYAM